MVTDVPDEGVLITASAPISQSPIEFPSLVEGCPVAIRLPVGPFLLIGSEQFQKPLFLIGWAAIAAESGQEVGDTNVLTSGSKFSWDVGDGGQMSELKCLFPEHFLQTMDRMLTSNGNGSFRILQTTASGKFCRSIEVAIHGTNDDAKPRRFENVARGQRFSTAEVLDRG